MFYNIWYCMIMGTLIPRQKKIEHADWFREQEQRNKRICEPRTWTTGLLYSLLELAKECPVFGLIVGYMSECACVRVWWELRVNNYVV